MGKYILKVTFKNNKMFIKKQMLKCLKLCATFFLNIFSDKAVHFSVGPYWIKMELTLCIIRRTKPTFIQIVFKYKFEHFKV